MRNTRSIPASGTVALLGVCLLGFAAAQTNRDPLHQEEALDHYRKWLRQDVVYIITPEEKQVFESLTSPEEKERFIEQFWKRRDPDPRTALNEFKEEHYRRIAYSNERFTSGFDGWRTDRGRAYILFGPPDELEKHPAGGPYERPAHEGGGRTQTYPFEVWRYHHIPGIGDNVEIEFVDPSLTGEYRMAVTPEEKDALFLVAGTGLTIGEEMGLEDRLDRVWGRFASNRENPLFDFRRAEDMPFAWFRRYADLQKPPPIQFRDLGELVETRILYHQLPLKVGSHRFRLGGDSALVPVTIELSNRDLTYQEENGIRRARVELYGRVESLTGEIVAEFDASLSSNYEPRSFELRHRERSAYQKILVLPAGLYKLSVVGRDFHGGRLGTVVTRLAVPHSTEPGAGPAFSSPLLSRQARLLSELPDRSEPFVLGDVKIIPQLDGRFYVGDILYLYFHLYNVPVDQSSGRPLLELSYRLERENREVFRLETSASDQLVRQHEDRLVVIRPLPLENFPPGAYRLRVEARDLVTGTTVPLEVSFSLLEVPVT